MNFLRTKRIGYFFSILILFLSLAVVTAEQCYAGSFGYYELSGPTSGHGSDTVSYSFTIDPATGGDTIYGIHLSLPEGFTLVSASDYFVGGGDSFMVTSISQEGTDA